MTERKSLEIGVITDNQDDVEIVNGTLRDAGHPAHCHWIDSSAKFDLFLAGTSPEFMILNDDRYPDSIRQVAKQKDCYHPEVPLLAMRSEVDERSILAAMKDGACDLVSIDNKERLNAVVDRELRAYRVERALNSTLLSASEYRRQLTDYMENSPSAIAFVQEGIIVELNNAWVKMFDGGNKQKLIGQPLMDSFRKESRAAIKGAVVATTEGKWQADEKLAVKSALHRGDEADLELDFRLAEHDDSPTVQVRINPVARLIEQTTQLVHKALKRDPTTLFYHRAEFLERLATRLRKKPASGLHVLAYIKIDNFRDVREQVGILDTEEVLAQFAEEVRRRMHPRDVAGRFEGTALLALLERGKARDAAVWGKQLADHVAKHEFRIGEQKIRLTCTVGVVGVSGVFSNLEELVSAAAEAHTEGRESGGNTSFLKESSDESTRLRKHDEIWLNHINTALRDNRFRLAQLPIAGLNSDAEKMFDMLIRMLDAQGAAVLPSEFLPAAKRNNMIKTIDRWMLAASMEFCAKYKAKRVFVRLSTETLSDDALVKWLITELGKHKLDPAQLCVQFPEQDAARSIKDIRRVVEAFHDAGILFALEHYGVDKNRFQILDILKPAYIKIDGELMHSLTNDTALQESVRELTSAALERGIETIAERVENANEMAVLFQLGLHYMQGHYVHEPEVVLEDQTSPGEAALAAIGNA